MSQRSSIRTHDFDYPESEMDDLESLYFDTISLADSEAAAAVAAARRKSLSQSRNTVYHSAVDLAGDETPSKRGSMRLENGKHLKSANYRHSTALDHYNSSGGGVAAGGGGGDYTDAAIAAQMMALQYGRGGPAGFGGSSAPHLNSDEVSRRLLQSNTNTSKDKKLPITYSQWKFRTRRRFIDGIRSVDFVLAYHGDDHMLDNLKKRETFEANLEKEGLQLERDNTQRIHFIKLHAPLPTLCRYAEILKIKLPMKRIPGEDLIDMGDYRRSGGFCRRIIKPICVDESKFPNRPQRIHCEFSRNYQHLFDWEHPNFFDAGIRNLIINFILERQHFVEGEETADNLGIEKLLEDRVYDSAYTLHDDTDRDLLLSDWANLKKWIHLQPLDYIKDYFGPKVALYFAWLGFYTNMLIPMSIFGILCVLYGFITWNTDLISQEICSDNQTTLMCPQCDRNCDYWELKDTCNSSKMNYLIDNPTTVVFAVGMSLWAICYLEFWKRYTAGLIHRWGLTGFSQEVEHPTPQYLSKLRNSRRMQKRSTADTTLEPDVPFWCVKFLPTFTSYSVMVLFICISIIALFAMVVYRMAQKTSHSILGNEDSMSYKILVLPMTAGVIDLIIISILDYGYSALAVWLTNLEYCRTHTEYYESLTIKNYIFQFVNYYSSLFYIAILKGKFVGYPIKYNRIFTFRQEECNPGGCLMELCMQLVIIMVGKQAVNAIVEMLIPYLMRTFRKYSGMRKRVNGEKLVACNQWTEDYHLEKWTNLSMYQEYLEMVLQFGFVTLFGLAFPLAPLLALINNVIEVRLDAIKMLRLERRPVAQRANNIGVWYYIMTIVTKISVASSAIIIAFSTNLIPKLIYRYQTNDDSLEGFLNFTLAYFDTKDFPEQAVPLSSPFANATSCRYAEFRNPPWDAAPYKRPMVYWKILMARLAFIVIFQNVIGVLQTVLAWAIPDVPRPLLKRIKREDFLLHEHIIEYEKKTATEKMAAQTALDAAQHGQSMGDSYNTSINIPIVQQQQQGNNNAKQSDIDMVQLRKRQDINNSLAGSGGVNDVIQRMNNDHITPL